MTTPTNFTSACASLGSLLDYPTTDFPARVVACSEQLEAAFPPAARAIDEFQARLAELSLERMEEVYTATFDLTPSCVPYISEHLFGQDSFKRGMLLVRLQQAFTKYGFNCGVELPDHLSVLLCFLPNLEPEELAELCTLCLQGPVEKMLAQLQQSENPYQCVLRAVHLVLATEAWKEHCHA